MIRTAVIGLGEVSKIHMPIIRKQEKAELVAVCDIDISLKEEYKGTPFYTDYLEMLDKEEINCVHICLPHYLHYEVTKACIEKGVNVFLEKPMALNYKEAKRLLEFSKKNSTKICLCLQNRLNASVEKLMGIKESGEYGRVLGVKGIVAWYRPKEYYQSKPWRKTMKLAGGGTMINQSIHTLDLMHYFSGEVDSLKGGIDNILYDFEVEDTAYANINFKNGGRGLFFSTVANIDHSSVELEVLFEKGKFRIKDSILTEIKEDGIQEEIIEDAKLPGTKFYYGASHASLISKFYDAILEDSENYISVEEGIESMKIIDGIRKSSELGRIVRMEEL